MNAKSVSAEQINEQLYRYDAVNRNVQSLSDVTDEHMKHYKEQGYIAIEHVLNEREIAQSITALMDILFAERTEAKIQFVKPQTELKTNEERELAVRKIYEFAEVEPALMHIALHPDILAIVEKLLGEKPKLVQDMALLKPPHGGGEKPWHQDMAYGNLTYDKPVVGVWIALDDAELDNGCMHVIPRSHMDGATPHYAIRDWQVCDMNVPVERDVAVPLQAGGILFFHGLLMHGTPNNFSDKKRRALQFHYVAETAEKMSPKEYKRMFTNELTGAEC